MDPNATLMEIEDNLETALAARDMMDRREHSQAMHDAREARANLLEWLGRGGFAPDWSRCPNAARFCGL